MASGLDKLGFANNINYFHTIQNATPKTTPNITKHAFSLSALFLNPSNIMNL